MQEKITTLLRKNLVKKNVALITGEEKIILNTEIFFCTVESIPESINFEFVAIDEIQMAADFEKRFFVLQKNN